MIIIFVGLFNMCLKFGYWKYLKYVYKFISLCLLIILLLLVEMFVFFCGYMDIYFYVFIFVNLLIYKIVFEYFRKII